MESGLSRNTIAIIAIVLVLVLGTGLYFGLRKPEPIPVPEPEPVVVEPVPTNTTKKIGASVEGREITAFTYGRGTKHLLFVGGIHGGYEWNSTALAYRFIDYLEENLARIPDSFTVTVIPSANPDGLFAVVGTGGRFDTAAAPTERDVTGLGRLNAREVDLNRNFDCKWKPTGTWRSKTVSAGTEPFSEPEAAALRDFVLAQKPDAVIFWHSQANAVYASECEDGILPATRKLMNAYADASGYPAVDSFDAYPVTGDAEGWLASIGIPAITVELETHAAISWEKNLAGIKAIFELFTTD